MKKYTLLLIISLIMGTLVSFTNQNTPYTYHSFYIYSFTKYIEWPGNTNELVICVLGNKDASAALKKMALQKSNEYRRYIIRSITSPEMAGNCQMIFVTKEYDKFFPKVVKMLEGKPTLIITESPELATKGSFINFFKSGDRLKFELNEEQFTRSGLKVSSSLLRMGKVL